MGIDSNSTKYEPLGPFERSERSSLDEVDILHPRDQFKTRSRDLRSIWPILCVLSWTSTALLAIMYSHAISTSVAEGFQNGWDTEFITARKVIEVESKVFTGAPAIADDGEAYIPSPDPIRYVGEPTPEQDHAWERLNRGRYFLIDEQEAKATWGDSFKDYWSTAGGGYIIGLDIFRTLNCLNQIRKKLHLEHYPPDHGGIESNFVHNGHCIEQIRQYLIYYSGLGRDYVLSDTSHTCRNFEAIREWTWERYNGSTAVQPAFESTSHPAAGHGHEDENHHSAQKT